MSDQELAQRVRALEVENTRRPELTRWRVSIYTATLGQSIPNNTIPLTTVNFDTLEEDDYSLVTTGANWVWTAPFPGRARLTTAIMFTTTTAWAAGEAGEIHIYKNGSKYSVLDRKDNYNTASPFMQLSGSRPLMVAAGDTLALRVYQNSGGSLALYSAAFGYSWIGIELTG